MSAIPPVRTLARAVVLSFGFAAGVGACERYLPKELEPAPYVPPKPGTVFRFAGFNMRVEENHGMAMRFADDSGRIGDRIGLFVVSDPKNPVVIDTAKMAAFWPLKNGNHTDIVVTEGKDQWDLSLNVVGEQVVDVEAGTFKTFLVQGTQKRRGTAVGPPTTLGHSWNYAPSIGFVVRFETAVVAGPNQGRRFASALRSVYRPDSAKTK